MNFLEKCKEKLNLPLVLFIIIFINYIPLIIPNMISKESHSASKISMMICFIIEILILIRVQYKKIEITKEVKKHFLLLTFITIIMFIIQIKNFIIDDFYFFDIVNIGCIFINIVLLYISIFNIKIKEEDINNFFKAIIYFGIFACFINLSLYIKEIMATIGIINLEERVNIKSFFANRNHFAFFLYVAIISTFFIMQNSNEKVYKYIFVIFCINLLLTMSRTGILAVLIFLILMFLFSNKVSNKIKIIAILSLIIIFTLTITTIILFFPEIWNKLNSMFFRIEYIKNLSGRTDIWSVGLNLLFENPINFIFGIGRFNSISLLHFETKTFTQYHNIYLDILLMSGLIGLAYFSFIYYNVIRKIVKSDLNKDIKRTYICMYITYGIYIMFESCGRFSLGSLDTLCLIFFITIPLLHSNSIKNMQKKNVAKKEK